MLAEAIVILVMKAAMAVLPLLVLQSAADESLPDGIARQLVLFALYGAVFLLFEAIALVSFTDLCVGRPRGARRFRRPPRAHLRTALTRGHPVRGDAATVPPPRDALRASSEGEGRALLRAGLFLAGGLPAVALCLCVLAAFITQLWWGMTEPSEDLWSWRAPKDLTGFGQVFFSGELIGPKILTMGASVLSLCGGIAMAVPLSGLIMRRGDEAIDLALTDEGLVVRGGFLLRWKELEEILVVRDRRMTDTVEPRRDWIPGMTRVVVNPTFIAHHSRTRIALIPWDMPEVAQRAIGDGPARCRALRVDRGLGTGYLLCDLWTHSPDAVRQVIGGLQKRCSRLGVRVIEVERGAWKDGSWGASETLGALTGRG